MVNELAEGDDDVKVKAIREALLHAAQWFKATRENRSELERGARRFALTVGRAAMAFALIKHKMRVANPEFTEMAIRRFIVSGLDAIKNDGLDMNNFAALRRFALE